MKHNQARTWQRDPAKLNTPTGMIQLWSASGTMVTAQLPIEQARELVASGSAFVISSQAVGRFDPAHEPAYTSRLQAYC